jgi:hypothetical protein
MESPSYPSFPLSGERDPNVKMNYLVYKEASGQRFAQDSGV